ncbi:helix-turn-helix domain-containing protein [Streptomyces sp. V2]|uniref:helix-turn-helix domain-containing protein n=1 Tax=Streptomyces sp. V2 TaxID=1424099 RepID=UPI0010576C41|nr:helix-turn-helix domain-containing protein [Streptomyces sp. V2]
MTLPRLLYPAKEVAEALGVSAYWLCEQARTGQIQAQKVAGGWKFTRAQVEWLISHSENAGNVATQQNTPTARRARATTTPHGATAPVVRLVAKPPRRTPR